MKDKGVIYFNQGNKCMIRMLVSIHSLRKHYSGSITVITKGSQQDSFLDILKGMKVSTLSIDDCSSESIPPLVQKASLWRYSPYKYTMFIDADTIICKPIDEYFELIKKHNFVAGSFSNWKTNARGSISRRIKNHSKICTEYEIKEALAYGPAINTGVFGFNKEEISILRSWEDLTRESARNDCSRIPDELACQIVMPQYKEALAAPECWGVSVKYHTPDVDPIVVHYHGRKHVGEWSICSLWKQEFWSLYWKEFHKGIHSEFLKEYHGDRRLREYFKLRDKKDMTFVSMVTKGKYLDSFLINYKSWLKTESIIEYPIHIYAVGSSSEEVKEVTDILVKEGISDRCSIKVIINECDWSIREKCLYTFVKEVPKYVTTKLWVKIDGDTAPKPEIWNGFGYQFDWDRHTRISDLVGHKWGYTKPGKWLVQLEKWADAHADLKDTKSVLPKENYDKWLKEKRGSFPRIASFVCVHNTEFSRQISNYFTDNLPVPSHDTYTWYMALRLDKKIKPVKMKRWFSSNGWVNPVKKICLIDGGYHKGSFTEKFLQTNKTDLILAVEPNIDFIDDLIKYPQAKPFVKGLRNYTGESKLYKATRKDAYSIYNDNKHSLKDWVTIDVINIIDLIDQIPKGYQIHLKLDIEGTEFEVLEELINKNRLKDIYKVYVEWHINQSPKSKRPELEIRKKNICKQCELLDIEVEYLR